MSGYPYEIWQTRRLLGVYRDAKPIYQYWLPFFSSQINSPDEYIDFEKLPNIGRKLAAFVMPLAKGKPVYNDRATLTRFKPAYIKLEDVVDPLMPLVKRAGIDSPLLESELKPMQRIDLIKAAITAAHKASIEARWDWMACKAIADAQVTISGDNYPSTLIDFNRDSGHTITLGSGDRFGDSGVSAFDFIQSVMDMTVAAAFGGVITKITMGNEVWAYLRQDDEFLSHMDLTIRGAAATIERGLVSSDKIFKVGEMTVGGQSGQKVELWVNNETYTDLETGSTTRQVGSKDMIFTGTAESINGFRCFGRIIDRRANYEPLDVFPANWLSNDDPQTEYLSHKSAPIMVPVNPNATAKATVLP